MAVMALKAVLSQTTALRLVGVARSTWHYQHHPRPRVEAPTPHPERRSAIWLSAAEEAVILTWLGREAAAIGEVFVLALDAGVYVASQRTWHRVARRNRLSGTPVRRVTSAPPRAVPEVVARAPNAVWSWDITWLPTRYRGQSYALYVALDVFSRSIVAAQVEVGESAELATAMFTEAFDRLQVIPQIIHADGGASMTSRSVQELFARLQITPSRNRPRVANDNPFSEAWFKTAKYHPSYPVEFASLAGARIWVDDFVAWYNHHHRHSGIAWHTPASVYDGSYRAITEHRQALLTAHYQAQPDRYAHPPVTPVLPRESWINNPAHRLQSD